MTKKQVKKLILTAENKLDDLYSLLYQLGYTTEAVKVGDLQYELMDIRIAL